MLMMASNNESNFGESGAPYPYETQCSAGPYPWVSLPGHAGPNPWVTLPGYTSVQFGVPSSGILPTLQPHRYDTRYVLYEDLSEYAIYSGY